jgi:tripartite-type tricarboxylate transporter receptor subunit TctC
MQPGARLVFASAAALVAALAAAPAAAQTWPQKPVRLVVSAVAGGSLDIPARAVADKLRDKLGQPVIVENRPAVGGTVAVGEVAKAAPDGYTLIYSFNGPLAYAPFLYAKLPYDVQRDLTPVILMGGQPFVLGVSAASGINSVKDLLEAARRQPGKLNYSSLGNGSGTHLTMELLKSDAKVFIVHIPYNGAVPAATAVAAGDVQAAFLPPAVLLPHVQTGRVKLIGMSSIKRFPLMPDVPTVAESGLPGFDSDGWNGILAPAGTPREVVLRLNREINDALASPDVREILFRNRIQAGGGTPEAFGELIARETKKWGPVIKFTGARLD